MCLTVFVYSVCVCSAWLSADGVSAEYALRGEDLHAVESSQRDQRGHHAVRGQSASQGHGADYWFGCSSLKENLSGNDQDSKACI